MTKPEALKEIARKVLHLETLDSRNSDLLDFKEQAVWSIAEALSRAYEAGKIAGKEIKEQPCHQKP